MKCATFFKIFFFGLCLCLVFSAGCSKSCGKDKKNEETNLTDDKNKPEKEYTGDIALPVELKSCGNDPTVHGAAPVPGRKGVFTCPANLGKEGACAYYVRQPSDDPSWVHISQFDNACRICAGYYKKNETWEHGGVIHTLIGFEEVPCSQGAYKKELESAGEGGMDQ